jgi:SOS-response transcriptional repressor LexA
MHETYKRLLQAAKALRGWTSQAELARGLTRHGYDVADPVLNNWRTRGVSKEGRLKASAIIGCRPLWLETGEGPINDRVDLENEEHTDNLVFLRSAMLDKNTLPGPTLNGMIPVISWVQAGLSCASPDLFHPGDADDWIPALRKFGPHTYALRVQGDSMVSPYPGQKSYPEGCFIFVDPDKPATNGCRVVARIHDEESATFKVYSEDAGKKYLKPLNPQYPTIELRPDMQVCGVVVGSWIDE